jgi:hypothetical protein
MAAIARAETIGCNGGQLAKQPSGEKPPNGATSGAAAVAAPLGRVAERREGSRDIAETLPLY